MAMAVALSACAGPVPGSAPGPDSAAPSSPSGRSATHLPPVGTDATPADPPLLLPNLTSLAAEDIHVEAGAGGSRLLRFAAVLANTGAGPLVVAPDASQPCPAGQRFASQIVYVDDGDATYEPGQDSGQRITPAGCMIFHPAHDHWHLDASARYSVTTADGSPVVGSDKVSFCLRDSRRLPGAVWSGAQETFGECDATSVQGITAGFGDVYRSDLDGQALALPEGLPDGRYCLTLSADPLDLLEESVEGDNATSVGLRLAGTSVAIDGSTACAATRLSSASPPTSAP
jgi:hypothetical protein